MDLTLNQFATLVAGLYRKESDDHVISIGDWLPSPVEGNPPLFHATLRITVGNFRRWAEEKANGH